MNLIETEIVRPEDSRPVGPPGACTYCRRLIGERHKDECVILSRTVVVRLTIDVVVREPRSHKPSTIEFGFNESSSCFDNVLERLGEWANRDRAEGEIGCSCGTGEAEFLREATPEDLATLVVLP